MLNASSGVLPSPVASIPAPPAMQVNRPFEQVMWIDRTPIGGVLHFHAAATTPIKSSKLVLDIETVSGPGGVRLATCIIAAFCISSHFFLKMLLIVPFPQRIQRQ